ncbi:MAG: FAD-dependent oxidoreductase [Nocardioidaceae bacterium]|nr:FAD-dependent oxidoreductase [Nocardioidaceae bacterium]
MPEALPTHAQVIVVGGGVIGCSVAYHLAKRGVSDVLLLEQNTLTSGTTWHAAGLVTQARPTAGMRDVVKRGLEVYRTLEEETGLSTGYMETGTLHLAMSADRHQELLRQASTSRGSGIRVEVLGPAETVDHFPLLSPAGLVSSLFYPDEGRATATDLTMSLARGARMRGVRISEGVTVNDIVVDGDRVVGVRTSAGDVTADQVVNCTGMWARQVGAMAGAAHPVQALAHYYVVTEKIDGMPDRMPTVKSSDDWSYVKDDAGSLMVGFFEPGSYPWASRGIPDDPGFIHLPEDWEHIGPFYERMIERIPVLGDAGIALFFCGPEGFTPDGRYHLGEVLGLRNYLVAAGFNSIGMLSGPGAGQVLADWIVDGFPSIDLPEADPRRTMPHETNRRFLEQRVTETLDTAYSIHWPFEQRTTARPLRRSILHANTESAGAVFGELYGWERPNWYAGPAEDRTEAPTWGRPTWFERSAVEHLAVRNNVGMLDISTYGKLLVQGPTATADLQRVSANDIDVPVGRIVYTQWLNARGGIEADLTVTRLGQQEYLVLTAPASTYRDRDWLAKAVSGSQTTVADVSGTMAMIAVMGPASRRLLQPLTDADLSDDAFPFASSREIDLGLGFVRATRITYVGELGWELLVPYDIAHHVWDVLTEAGQEVGLRPAGYHALNSLRMEKAYRSWGHDISGGDTPLEAGLGFAVAWDKPGGFIGRDALLEQRENGVRRRLVQLALDDPEPLLLHDEPVFRDGQLVGRVSSAAYGHSLGRSVGLAYLEAPEPGLPRSWFESGAVEVELACERHSARVSLRPMYDPTSERPKS